MEYLHAAILSPVLNTRAQNIISSFLPHLATLKNGTWLYGDMATIMSTVATWLMHCFFVVKEEFQALIMQINLLFQ